MLTGSLFVLSCCGCAAPSADGPGQRATGDREFHREAFDLQGHRGARGLSPENTLPAFRRALELGVDTLEMDVVVNADNHVVVSHEPWMSSAICSHPDGRPVTVAEERELNIYHLDDATLTAYDCGARQHPDFPRQRPEPARKPLLAEVFEAVRQYEEANPGRAVRFSIEIKSRPEHDGVYHPPVEAFAQALSDVIGTFGMQPRTAVQSFDPRALEAIHRSDPGLQTVWLIGNRLSPEENLDRLTFTPDIYSPHFERVDPQLAPLLQARGIGLIPWTVNEVADMQRLIGWGVDGLITDYPDIALDVLRALAEN